MAEGKKSFLLYSDMLPTVKKLVEKDRINKTNNAGELFLHLLEYVCDNNPEPINDIVDLMFEPIKTTLKRDLAKWEEKSPERIEKARIAGLASAEARRLKKELNSTNELNNQLNSTNSTVSVSVSVNDTDLNNVVIGEKSPKLPKTNLELLNIRKDKFYKDVGTFAKEYSKELLRAFYDYWTEPNKSNSKMRWEMEKTFSLSLRLKNWSKNEKGFANKNPKNTGLGI